MFYFITTLRHPKNAKNYQSVIDLLKLTIESVCNQKTQHPYKLLVVCNEIPDIEVDTNRVEYHAVDFPPPGEGKASELLLRDMHFDKGVKIAAGLLYMQQHNPSKVFIIDADDWVNQNIVETTASQPDVDFWYADRGYLVNFRDKKYIRKHGLCRYCGTTFIYDYQKLISALGFNTDIPFTASREEIANNIEDFPLVSILGNHRFQFSYMNKFGYSFKVLPYNAICWILNTGENHSGKTGGDEGLPLDQKTLSKFGMLTYTPSTQKASIMNRISEVIEKSKSHLGWIFTDKKADKV
jgi:hypothetical protein